jgi:hypothetical protein
MQRLRTKTLAVRLLVALFLAAQFAGVIALPPAHAHVAVAAHAAHHHDGVHAGQHTVGGHRNDGCAHPDACPDRADYCCALHAFFVGILPPSAGMTNPVPTGEALRSAVTRAALGYQPGLLDRPPRPLS